MIQTTPAYWECACAQHYLHARDVEVCPACGRLRTESPDARVDDVLKALCDPRLVENPDGSGEVHCLLCDWTWTTPKRTSHTASLGADTYVAHLRAHHHDAMDLGRANPEAYIP